MANGNGGIGTTVFEWGAILLAGVMAVFGLGRMKQQLDQHDLALNLRVTLAAFAGLVTQVERMHEDVRDIRTMLESRRDE